MDYLLVLGGLVLLIFGGEGLVRGSVSIARKVNVSELVIGLTLVGFGTSMPELVTSLRAIESGAVGISIGNVIGSNIANILLVLGLAALIKPILTNPQALKRDAAVVVVATAAVCALVYFDAFTRVSGFLMIGALIAYLAYSLWADQKGGTPAAEMHAEESELVAAEFGVVKGLVIAVAGLAGIIYGASLLVDGAVGIARAIGVSEAVIGMSIVAVGTSLPELATSVIAATRGRADVALGNVIGSNIFNILGILGITALVHPFSVMKDHAGDVAGEAMQLGGQSIVTTTDAGALVLSLFFLLLFGITGKKIARWEGGVLLAGYVLYMGLLFNIIPVPALLPNG
ncbi:MAG TPA: calcium/sodium antiporter [Hyphomonas sp.]|nr:calcium/sodium antiporter [Hyphomonas sp.]HRX74080.1 calcium/sodium antiporter [Hyphomonas sp.]